MAVQKKIKIIYVFSFIDRSLLNEAIARHLSVIKDFDLSFILLHPYRSSFIQFLEKENIRHWHIQYSGKRDLPRAIWSVFSILIKERPHIVNVNLQDATIVALPLAWILRIPVRILSRHHGSFHHIYHPHFVKYDRMLSKLATHIVVPSQIIRNLLIEKEGVVDSKIIVIYHGLPLNEFVEVEKSRIAQLEKTYFSGKKPFPVIGVISRFTEWKGIQYIIPAFRNLLSVFPEACLLLANARGDYQLQIRKSLQALPDHSYRMIDFEEDAPALYRLMDVFVHVPIRDDAESFGQVYVEALASGVPSVFTLSGVAPEFIQDGRNALVVPFCDSTAIEKALLRLLHDASLRNHLISQGRTDAFALFDSSIMSTALERFFRNTLVK